MIPVLIAAALIGGFIWWDSRQQRFGRDITLRQNQWYYVAVRDTSGATADDLVTMVQSLGFCEVSEATVTTFQIPGQPALGNQVQITARWCNPDTAWTVPENVAITKAS